MNPSKNRGAAAQLLPVQVPANGRFAVKATGSFLSIVESPVRVGIKLDSGGWAKCAAGTSLSCKDGAYFEGFEIENPSANAITVLVYTGFAEFIDRRVAVIEPATAVRGAGGQLAAGASIDLAPVPQGLETRRKLVLLTNGSSELRLQVLDTSGNVVLVLFPETSVNLTISEGFSLKNANGAPVEYYIGQVWWLSA